MHVEQEATSSGDGLYGHPSEKATQLRCRRLLRESGERVGEQAKEDEETGDGGDFHGRNFIGAAQGTRGGVFWADCNS